MKQEDHVDYGSKCNEHCGVLCMAYVSSRWRLCCILKNTINETVVRTFNVDNSLSQLFFLPQESRATLQWVNLFVPKEFGISERLRYLAAISPIDGALDARKSPTVFDFDFVERIIGTLKKSRQVWELNTGRLSAG